MRQSNSLCIACVGVTVVLLLAACGSRQEAGPTAPPAPPPPSTAATQTSPAPPAAPAYSPTTEEWVSVPVRIRYSEGGAETDAQSEAMLRELKASLAGRGDIVDVSVEGHADGEATPAGNQQLGRERAQNVVDHLVDDLGMSRDMFKVRSHGDRRPITSDTSAADRIQNRRVEVKVLVRRQGGATSPSVASAPLAVAAHQQRPRPSQQPQAEPQKQLPRVNDFREASQDNLATFSLDVDTASYTLTRAQLNAGSLPAPQAVRVEEFINFFDYNQTPPSTTDGTPFAVHLESAPSPFGGGGDRNLLRVGVQGIEVSQAQRPAANLVFLVDVSGSMNQPDKLPLVQFALTTLVNTLRPDDTIGIVIYAGHEAVLLEPTAVSNRGELLSAIQNLRAGGSTHGEAGIRAAYDLAQQHFRQAGINRVILCSDGDFNVGLTGDALIRLIERYRRRQITLTVLGFGRSGNDRDMERLADHGNGSYAFVDNRNEALRVLGRNLQGTIQVIAGDVKVQVIFNPEVVSRFRLIGYENRVLAHRDFENDAVDAAEIGSGQFVTAYLEYELRPGVQVPQDARDLVTVRLRYKRPGEQQSIERRYQMPLRDIRSAFTGASQVFRYGAAVAEFAEILRHSEHSTGNQFNDVIRIAQSSTWSQSSDTQEFVELVRRAQQLWQRQ